MCYIVARVYSRMLGGLMLSFAMHSVFSALLCAGSGDVMYHDCFVNSGAI